MWPYRPRISGFLQAGYQYSDTSSEFFVKRARLSLTGDIVPKFDYKIQFEFAKPRLVDAYLQYRPFPQFGLRGRAVQDSLSLENTEYGVSAFEFIDYPLALSRLMAFDEVCGLAASGRDIGAACSGGFFSATVTASSVTIWPCSTARVSIPATATSPRISSRG